MSETSGFSQAWDRVDVERDGESVSPELEPLLEATYTQLVSDAPDHVALQTHLQNLLEYLSSPGGRTNANCWATDLFFGLEESWARDWTDSPGLPEDLHEVLARMGQALHDTVANPEVAESFGCLPEQLLERLH